MTNVTSKVLMKCHRMGHSRCPSCGDAPQRRLTDVDELNGPPRDATGGEIIVISDDSSSDSDAVVTERLSPPAARGPPSYPLSRPSSAPFGVEVVVISASESRSVAVTDDVDFADAANICPVSACPECFSLKSSNGKAN